MLKVLCFGNQHFENDRLALEVGKKLKNKILGVEFLLCGINEDYVFESENKDFLVLDVVKGIENVRFVEPSELKTAHTVTAHDIDVSFYLKVLEKEGKRIKIIGIPEGMDMEKAAGVVKSLLVPISSSKAR
jgi:Ni,Fe-hydrogenase maturation factor